MKPICEAEFCENAQDYTPFCRECHENEIRRQTKELFLDIESQARRYAPEIRKYIKTSDIDYETVETGDTVE